MLRKSRRQHHVAPVSQETPAIDWVVDRPGLRLGCGDSVNYTGDADLVFSHLYGPLPKHLIGKPAIINVYGNKRAKAEEWCGSPLAEVSKWGRGLKNTIFVANTAMRSPIDLTDFIEDEFAPGRGWFPVEMCTRILNYVGEVTPGGHVFDGFMGRGTVGMACADLGLGFVGIDRDPDRVQLAREYLGC